MGNHQSSSKRGTRSREEATSVVKHEKLKSEYNHRYFAKVASRNARDSTKRCWPHLPKFHFKDAPSRSSSLHDAVATEVDVPPSKLAAFPVDRERLKPDTQSSCFEEESAATLMEDHTHLMSVDTRSTALSSTFDHSFQSSLEHHSILKENKSVMDLWNGSQKGQALQHRLAKNRNLQLAVSGEISPLTVDQSVRSKRFSFDPLNLRDDSDDSDAKFEANDVSQSPIWVELSRPKQVSAIAMSRPGKQKNASSLSHKMPLLLALGDEEGLLTVTEIVDEQGMYVGDASSSSITGASPESRRDFGETFDLPLQGRIRSIDFSPDGKYLVAAGDGCSAYILQLVFSASGAFQNIRVVQKVDRVDRIYSVQFSPDSKHLATTGYDARIAIYDLDLLLANNSALNLDKALNGLLFCLDWNPKGTLLATAGSSKHCLILSSATGQIFHRTKRRPAAIQALKWSHSGSRLAIGDREVTVLDGKSFHVLCEVDHSSFSDVSTQSKVLSLCWSPDNSYLAAGCSDGKCVLIETSSYTLVSEVQRKESVVDLAWGQQSMANGEIRRYLGIADSNCSAVIVKAGVDHNRPDKEEVQSSVSSSYFTENSNSGWVFNESSFQDIDECSGSSNENSIPSHEGRITSIAFSKVCKSQTYVYLAYAATDCSLTILTTRDWKPVFQIEFAKPVHSLAFSNLNNHLALGGDEGVLYVLSVPSRSMILNTILGSPINSLSFSKHDEFLAVGTKDGTVSLMSPANNYETVAGIENSEAAVTAQDWSSRNFAVGRQDGTFALYETHKIQNKLFVPQLEFDQRKAIRSVSFGASGRFLAVSCASGDIDVYSAKGGWVLCNRLSLDRELLATSWCPAGRYLALAGKRQLCRIIDTVSWADVDEVSESLADIFSCDTGSGAITSLSWSVDGKWIALGNFQGGIHVLKSGDWHLISDPTETKGRYNLASGSFAGTE